VAKFKVEIELDYVREDWSLDEEIKHEVKKQVIQSLQDGTVDEIRKLAVEFATNQVAVWVDEIFTQEFETAKFPYRASTYSREVEELTMREIFSKEFDKALNQQVDKNGHEVGSCSGSSPRYTRLDYIAGKAAKEIADEKVKAFAKDFPTQISSYLTSQLKSELVKVMSLSLVESIDLNSIFRRQVSKDA